MQHTTKLAMLGASLATTLFVAVGAVAYGATEPATATLFERGADEATAANEVSAPPTALAPVAPPTTNAGPVVAPVTTKPAVATTTPTMVVTPSAAPGTTPSAAPGTTPPRATTIAAPPTTVARPLRRVLVGDSITVAYGPLVPGATVLGGSGEDAANYGWEAALRAGGPADIIVLQDYVVLGLVGPREQWVTAWRSLVATANSLAPKVFILVGGPEAALLASLPALPVAMPAPDDSDGIHYTNAGSVVLAEIVAALR